MAEPAFKRLGKYEIQAELGRGGFGTVFRAFDPTVGRLVAIKALMSEGGTDLITRFRNEATAAGNLRHENIVTIYEFGDDKGVPFIVMEYLEGEDLQQALASCKPLTLLEKVSIMTQAAAGLDCAHRHNVIHRDVKPGNIRLLPDGRVKIMDFGIARLVRDGGRARLTRQGHLLGTLLYMAPEQLMGSDSDALSDIFAYGVTFYELLTGRHPFQAEDPRSVFYKITSEDPEPIHDLVPDCPETLDQVIRRALHKERELRYQTLRDLRVDVEPVLSALRKERAGTLVTEAHRLAADRSFEPALSLLNEAIDLDSANHSARQLRETVQGELRRRLVRPRIDGLLAKADRSLAEENYSEAIQALESALQLDSQDPSLHARAREAQQRRDQWREARRLVAEARVEFGQGSLAGALQKLSEALALNPASAEAQTLLEIVQRELDRRKRQQQLGEKLRQARELLLVDSLEEAFAVMDTLEVEEREEPEALELLGRLAGQRSERERRDRLAAEIAAAGELLGRERFIEAIELLQRLRPEFPGEPQVERLLADAEQQLAGFERAQAVEKLHAEVLTCAEAKQFEEAAALLGAGIEQYPNDTGILRLRDSVLFAQSAWERQKAVERTARRCEALADEGRFEEALEALGETQRKYPDEAALDRLQRRLEADGESFRRAQAVAGALECAERLLRNNQPEDAVAQLEPALAAFPDERLRTALAHAQQALAAKQRAAHLDQIERDVEAHIENRDFEEALRVLDRAAETIGESEVTQLRGTVISARAQAALEEQAHQAEARAAAIGSAVDEAGALVANGRADEAVVVLERARSDLGASPELEQSLSRASEALAARRRDEALAVSAAQYATHLIDSGSLAEAGRALQKAIREFPGNPELAAVQLRLRAEWDRRRRSEATRRAADNARVLVEHGQAARAIQLLEAAAAQYPDDPIIRDAIAAAREARGDTGHAEMVEAVCRETRLYLDRNDFDGALETIATKLHMFSGEPRLIELRETVMAARRDFERGVSGRRASSVAQAITDEPSMPILPGPPPLAPSPSANAATVHRTRVYAPRIRKIALLGLASGLGLAAVLAGIREMRPGVGAIAVAIETTPSGAAVTVGGKSCTTPECRLRLPAGDYQVEARLAGYSAASETIRVRKGQTTRARLDLAPLPTSLVVTGNAGSGSVDLDGRSVGLLMDGQLTVNQLSAGLHHLRISSPAGDASLSFISGPAQPPELKGEISTRDAAAVVVTSFGPSVAAACSLCQGKPLIDGKPLNGQAIETGSHELTARTGEGRTERLFFRTGDAPAIAIHLTSTASTTGTLVVETNVDGASVSIDRRSLGRQTAGGRVTVPLEPGKYKIEVRKPGYRVSPDHLSAAIRKGDQFRAQFRLDPVPGAGIVSGAAEASTARIESPPPAPQPLPPAAAQPTPPAPPTAQEIEGREWTAVRSGRDPAATQAFLKKHPDSAHAPEARQMLAQMEWETLDRKDRPALERFAARYRGTPIADQANAEIARIEREAAASAALAAAKKAEDRAGADRAEISRVISTYASAFEKKDLNLLKTIWPELPEAALAPAFRSKGAIRSQLRPLAPAEITGDRAIIRCVRITEQATQFGRQKPVEESRTVRLRRESGRWVISAID